MKGVQNILVGIDLSLNRELKASALGPVMQAALDSAVWLARLNGAELTFFSALDLTGSTWYILGAEERERVKRAALERADRFLSELADRAKDEAVRARGKVVEGTGWVEIVRQVVRDHHDLVIVGTRNLRGLSRILLGSTAMELVHECPCPVWVIKPGSEPHPHNVLVASDLTAASDGALRLAVSLAGVVHAQVHLAHVVDYPLDHLWSTGQPDPMTERYHREVREGAAKAIREQLGRSAEHTLAAGVQTHILDGTGVPDLELLQFIQDHHIDLLALGTMTHEGVEGAVVGNTVERMLPEVPCSVLAVKPEGFRTSVPLE